jgi:hypothetical protein
MTATQVTIQRDKCAVFSVLIARLFIDIKHVTNCKAVNMYNAVGESLFCFKLCHLNERCCKFPFTRDFVLTAVLVNIQVLVV